MTAAARVVLVSGAASGIGAATARRFAEGGDHVALVDIDGAHAKAVADQLTETGATVEAFECDVTDAAAVDELMSGVLERFGRLDVACNNAGRDGGTRLPFEDVPLDTFDAVMSLNARAVFVCMQREIAAMRGQGGGVIVNTASISGLGGTPNSPAYSASKHAVVGLTKSAALELASSGIRVNAVAPGVVDTALLTRVFGEDAAENDFIKSMHPLGRAAHAEEVAAAIVWLASSEASFVTGVVVPVDGGIRAR